MKLLILKVKCVMWSEKPLRIVSYCHLFPFLSFYCSAVFVFSFCFFLYIAILDSRNIRKLCFILYTGFF